MQLNAITMPKDQARAAFEDYRRAVAARHSKEDAAIMRGYKALSKGLRVVNLRETIIAGGEDERRRPRLAVARADVQRVFVRRYYDGRLVFGTEDNIRNWGRWRRDLRREFLAGTFPAVAGKASYEFVQAAAIVPTIPPRLRPAHALRGYQVLFEAEWSPVAPKDPALLKHLAGELYAVLAVWDLTDLERAVLAGRASA